MAEGTELTIRKRISRHFRDELRFVRGLIDRPRTTGAILPSSARMATRMASVINVGSGLPVLELGPGTGVITRAILKTGIEPARVWSVEYSQEFVRHLRKAHPDINVVRGDAFALSATLGPKAPAQFDCVISGIPLLNFPMHARVSMLIDLLERIPVGRPVVQFSYGPKSPIAPTPDHYTIERFAIILRNIPPAQVWIYRKIA